MIYKYIHKHHHRTTGPHRGADDSANANPIEYIVTAFFIPLSFAITATLIGAPVHAITCVSFTVLNAVLSHVNHSRIKVRWVVFGRELYFSGNHDSHHRLGSKGRNYSQLFLGWDHLFGSYVSCDELDNTKKK